MNTLPLAVFAELAGVTERRIRQLAEEGTLPAITDGHIPFESGVRQLINYYREQASGTTATVAADRARQVKADADSAVMDAEKKAKTLCFRSDYQANYADAIAQGVRNISRLPDLTTAQKESVMQALRSVRLPDLENAE